MIGASLCQVFARKSAWLLGGSIFIFTLILVIILPNIKLIGSIVSSEILSGAAKTKTLLAYLVSFGSNATASSVTILILLSLLFALHIVIMVHMIRMRRSQVGSTTGFLGLVSGIFGIGCAACGSLLLSTVFVSTGSAALIAGLPLGGEEFGILGIILLAVSLWITLRKLNKPLTCPIEGVE